MIDDRTDGARSGGPEGQLFAGRYRLNSVIGHGGHGEVWAAEDRLGGGECALKLMDVRHVDPARVRREIAALRILQLPGVVRLIDEGTFEGRAFLVMERVEGAPFPGVGVPCSLAALAPVALSLLEVLSRVHAAGVVHRDLKPSNVLVSSAGRVTVLDFGISAGAALGQGLTVAGHVLGTPEYLSPEQIRGDPVSAATDLYAVGVMLYHALSGRLPHEADGIQALLRARISRPPTPLHTLAPGVPASVSALVMALLADEPEDRPASAADAITALAGRSTLDAQRTALPRLGGDTAVQALAAALRSGRSCDLVGTAGSGRTRVVEDALSILRSEGRQAISLGPGTWAFDSLDPVTGGVGPGAPAVGGSAASERLAEVVARVDSALAAAIAGGGVIVADDAHRLDRWSLEAIDRARPRGGVVRVWSPETSPRDLPRSEYIEIHALSEADLRPLFTGPERLFHLPSDAARALHLRTDGLPGRIDAEVRAWIRAGLARPDGPRLAVDREALDRMESGLPSDLGPSRGRATSGAPAHLRGALEWIAFSAPNATAELVARASDLPLFRAEEAIFDLSREGLVEGLPSGQIVPRRSLDPGWTEARRREAHRTVARLLPRGTEGRILHLIAGEEPPAAIAQEALSAAAIHAREGRTGKAMAVLSEGMIAARRAPLTGAGPVDQEEIDLLSLWAEIAMAESTVHALDKVLYEISRSSCDRARIEPIEGLVRAAIAAVTGGGERALSIVDAVPPFEDVTLERRRQSLRVLAARRCPLAREEEVVEEAIRWAESSRPPTPGDRVRTRAAVAGWTGRLRYRQDRFDEAASLYAEAAEGEAWITERVASRLRAASALMEAFRLEEARGHAVSAREIACLCRHARYEARAEWLVRAVDYRLEAPLSPDHELCDLAGRAGVVELEAFVCLNEAAVALRAGQMDVAADLASRADRVWTALHKPVVAGLARALAWAAGKPAEGESMDALARSATESPVPVIGLQTLGLIARVRPREVRAIACLCAPHQAAIVPAAFHGVRLEVLSVSECLAALASDGGRPSETKNPP